MKRLLSGKHTTVLHSSFTLTRTQRTGESGQPPLDTVLRMPHESTELLVCQSKENAFSWFPGKCQDSTFN